MEKTPIENSIRERLFPDDRYLSAEKLAAYQLAAMRQNIEYVKQNSPFYRQLLSGISANDLKTLADIKAIPFTYPEDIRAYGNKMICVGQGDISRVVTLDTSGTSGAPKRIYFTPGDQDLTIDFFHHGMTTFTKKGDRVLILLPGARPGSVGDLLKEGLTRIPAEGVIYGIVEDFEKAEKLILDEYINVIVGVPQQVFRLSQMDKARLIKGKGCLQSVLLSTDYVPDSAAERIKDRWGCEVYEHYGMTEMGLGGGVYCKALKGYHFREADMLFEIVDPCTGMPLPDGEYGEVVFTTLTRRGMPLMRYRTGDISRFLKGRCGCGTVLKTMGKIRRRLSSGVRLKSGYLLTMPELDEILFETEGVLDFSAEVRIAEGFEFLTLYVNSLKSIADMRNALMNSGLRDILRRGELKLEILKTTDKAPDTKGTGKRSVADMRPCV